jgi:predicted lipoprotein with Yx(FWY)xxD motif
MTPTMAGKSATVAREMQIVRAEFVPTSNVPAPPSVHTGKQAKEEDEMRGFHQGLEQGSTRPARTRRAAALAAIGALALLVPMIGAAQAAGKRVAKEVPSSTLGKNVLANLKGRTLYSLSVEKHGKFICTSACLSTWHPLIVPAGTKPTGPVTLGTVERPEGRTQVTFKGRPLYTFAPDTKAGEAGGEGIKDVGTWHAAVLGGAVMSPPESTPQPTPQEPTPQPTPTPTPNPPPTPTPTPTPPYPSPY